MCKLFKLLVIICLGLPFYSHAQKPSIVSVDKSSGGLNEIVTVRGSDFGVDATSLKVFFGGAAAEIDEVSNQLITAKVPAGATYDNISVTNTTNGLSGYSDLPFLLKFNGEPGLAAEDFGSEVDFNAESGLYDLCLCDFNGDGKTDIATASDNSNSLAFFQNGSAVSTINFTRTNFLINAKSLHSACGDINGDGRPDLVLSEGSDSDRIFVFRNTGGFTFNISIVRLLGRKVKRVAIADLDLNGKPEVVVTDKGSNIVTILPNQSTLAAIAFGAAVNIVIPGPVSTDALEIRDINGNGLPEIVTSQFLTTASNIFICDNKSTPGAFNFSDISMITIGNTIVNVKIGDLDGDSKPDLAATRLTGSDISVFLNQSTASQISFGTPVSVLTAVRPWGLDFGDLDGDGKTDIVVGSIANKSITVLNNQSTVGSLSFSPMVSLTTNFITRHIRIGDIDGDAKPDIAFTSIDDNNLGIPASKISVLRNKTCFIPTLSPVGPLSICSGFELELNSSEAGGVTYNWNRDATSVKTGPESFLDITQSGSYTVIAQSEGGSCAKTSNAVSITVAPPGAGLNSTPPDARSNSPVCNDNTLNLQVNNVAATEYKWTGPNGFTSNVQNPTIPNFTIERAGLYIVQMIAGSCIAKIDSTIVEGISNPDFTITFAGSNLLCEGNTKTLNVSPVVTSGFTFQWFEKTTGMISGAAGSTYGATATGEYYANVISSHPGCAPVETPAVTITVVTVPDANFSPSASTGCVGQEITFTNQSSTDANTTPAYVWMFGDAAPNNTETSPKHTYTQPGTYAVKLRVTYPGESCPNEETKNISILSAPAVSITNGSNRFNLCPGDTLRLNVSGDTFTSYSWSNGATTPFIIVDQAQDYSVNVTNSAGCIIQATRTVSASPAPTVTATAEPREIKVGERAFLTAVGNNLESYLWRPGVGLSDSTTANSVATPLQNTTYTVMVTDINGCRGQASVEVFVLGSSALNLITPKAFFSPNDDEINQFWTIDDIESFPQCSVSIFNDKGAKIFEAKPYNNDWDGTFKGNKLPGGVYYYVIRCDGDPKARTGSITLLK